MNWNESKSIEIDQIFAVTYIACRFDEWLNEPILGNYLLETIETWYMLCNSWCAIDTNKNVVVKVTFSGLYHKGFYDIDSNSTIACQSQTKFWGREVQDDRNWPPLSFLSLEYHGGFQTLFSEIIKRGLGPKVFPRQ